jgi:anti-sigma factor RsiW
MDCALVRNHLDAYVDGELEPSPSATLETHLHACPVCRDELTMSRALKRAVHGLPRPALSESFRANVVRALDQEERGASRRGVGFTATLAVAAAALLAVVALKRPDVPPVAEAERPVIDTNPVSAFYEPIVSEHLNRLPPEISEPSAVSSWISSRLGFRVQPVEFGSPNVRLVSARVSNIGGQAAARLDYTVGNAPMTVHVFQPPAALHALLSQDDQVVARLGGRRVRVGSHVVTYQNVRGYTVPMLEQGGLAYAFTGDLDEQSLLKLIGAARLP